MALKTSVAVLLSLNLLFFSTLSSSSFVPRATPTPQPSSCPMDILKLKACAGLSVGVGSPAQPCCSLIRDLVDLDAAVCLCTAIKANVLGINLNVPVSWSLIINGCGKSVPSGFQCA